MRCEHCDNGERRPVRRAQVAEKDGRTALVLGVPVEVCDACGQVWLSMKTAKRLDAMFTRMLASDLEVATRHFDTEQPRAA
ncbi:YgiT-type zinc finger protein [uncultured Pseudokineococcus sp.]|uniref:YgiT-type zinc finger protein n=1 Tax=uncultured Pseudokineococcus sp. TaxID=1642928 RepID=UPI00260D4CB5|nr:YgiT-type zinc finger protein [uncultured Pseudokineococcus sp.]